MAAKKSTKKRKAKTSKKKATTTEVAVVAEVVEEKRQDTDQVVLNPKQALLLQLYYDPKSPTWGSARGSAIAAGFSENYANQFTYHKPEWFIGFHRKNSLIDKIETHFQEVMELPNITQAMGAFGPIEKKQVITEETGEVYKSGKRKGQPKTKKRTIKVPVYVPNVAVIKAKNEVAKIAAPAHDPDRYGKKSNTNNFIFNMTQDREKYA